MAGRGAGAGNINSRADFLRGSSPDQFARSMQAIGQLGESGFSKANRNQRVQPIWNASVANSIGCALRLLDLAQEKNKFLRHMSHELKDAVSPIFVRVQNLLLDGSVGDLDRDPQREVTDILRMNGLKLQQLIENLLSHLVPGRPKAKS